MSRAIDPFEQMPEEMRIEAMRETVFAVLGQKSGAQMWERIEPALRDKRRQIGDHPDPSQTYWKGIWRIYEAE